MARELVGMTVYIDPRKTVIEARIITRAGDSNVGREMREGTQDETRHKPNA
jgi:hypothetical protein